MLWVFFGLIIDNQIVAMENFILFIIIPKLLLMRYTQRVWFNPAWTLYECKSMASGGSKMPFPQMSLCVFPVNGGWLEREADLINLKSVYASTVKNNSSL